MPSNRRKTTIPYSTTLLREVRRDIGRQIHDARVKEKMTLAKLSKLTGIFADMLDRFELGMDEIRVEDMVRVGCVLF